MFEFELPDVGEGVSEGELVEWHVQPGDHVEEDDVLAEVETDKAIVELPAPVTGTVRELHAEEGEMVPVGDVVISIEEDGEGDAEAAEAGEELQEAAETAEAEAGAAPEGDTEQREGGDTGRVFAPPQVRRLAREMGVDIAAVDGSGPGGRVTEEDVRAAAGAGGSDDEAVASAITQVDDGSGASSADAGDRTGGDGESGPKSAISRAGDTEGATGDGQHPEAADREETLAVPATRALAEELGVDLDEVPTDKTRDGKPFVEEADVRAYAEALEAAETAEATADVTAAEAEATAAGAETGAAGAEMEAGETVDEEGVARREPYRGIRRTIGERMAESHDRVPRATHHDSVDVADLVEVRERLKPHAEERGVGLTYLPFVLKAVVAGLREYPVINTRLDEEAEEIVYHDTYDIGVATATEAGLLVPVVEDVGERSILDLAAEVRDLTERARERDLAPEEMRGGTFSVTNFGAIGGEYAVPIVNYPETAILGLGAIEERPVAADGEVLARPTLPLSLAIDHRVIDGADGAGFVNTVMDHLREPTRLLLE